MVVANVYIGMVHYFLSINFCSYFATYVGRSRHTVVCQRPRQTCGTQVCYERNVPLIHHFQYLLYIYIYITTGQISICKFEENLISSLQDTVQQVIFPMCKFSRISRMSSQLGKIYSGLLQKVRLGVAIGMSTTTAYVQITYERLSLIWMSQGPVSSKTLQSIQLQLLTRNLT